MCKERFINEEEAYRDYNNTLQTAEWVGEERGRAEGRAEEKRDMARRLLESGVDINVIASASGLSVDEIERL